MTCASTRYIIAPILSCCCISWSHTNNIIDKEGDYHYVCPFNIDRKGEDYLDDRWYHIISISIVKYDRVAPLGPCHWQWHWCMPLMCLLGQASQNATRMQVLFDGSVSDHTVRGVDSRNSRAASCVVHRTHSSLRTPACLQNSSQWLQQTNDRILFICVRTIT